MSDSDGSVEYSIEDHVCTVTIRNEGKRNAFDYAMIEELTEIFEMLEERDRRAIVVLRGAGEKAFSAGFDLSIDRIDESEEEKQLWPRMVDTIENYSYPVVAMVNGDTYGGAVEVIAACDIRVGVNDARFAITPAKIGLVYGGHAINRVMEVIGPSNTKELLFTADSISAAHALEIGLLNHAVERDELTNKTYDIAESIAANAPYSLRKMKEIVDITLEKRRLTDAEEKWVQHVRDQARQSEDYAEGIAAFDEGRKPEFENR
jgi:enoyl-CoA hydratase